MSLNYKVKLGRAKTFNTRTDAMDYIDDMIGWDAHTVRFYDPEDANANRNGNVWCVATIYGNLVREDGFIY